MPIIHSIFEICFGNFDATTLQLPFNIWIPFDTTTILGWYILSFLQFNTGIVYSLTLVAGTTYFLSCCIYIVALCDQFKYIMQMKYRIVDKNSGRKYNGILQMKQQLSEAIEIHNKGFE